MTVKRSLGDSLANEYGVTATDGWRYKLAADQGAAITQLAVNGAQCADLAGPLTSPGQLYGLSVLAGESSVLRVSTNDARIYGLDTAKREIWRRGLRAALNVLTRNMQKVKGSSLVFSSTGWEDTYVYGVGRRSGTNGAWVDIPVTGTGVHLNMIQQNVNTGSFRVTVDGVDKGEFSLAAPGLDTQNGITYGPAGFYFGGLTPGQTLRLTVTSPTVYGAYLYFDAYGSDAAHATTFLTNIAEPETGTVPPTAPPVGAIAAYNADIDTIAAEYNGDVKVVDVRAVLTSADMIDIHERPSGQTKVFNAIKLAKDGPPLSGDAVVKWEGSNFFIERADGSNRKQIQTVAP